MCCLCSALCNQSGTARAPRSTVAVVFCGFFFFFFAVVLLLMTYSFASLHSACLENNEHVCCINLCNGKQEEG